MFHVVLSSLAEAVRLSWYSSDWIELNGKPFKIRLKWSGKCISWFKNILFILLLLIIIIIIIIGCVVAFYARHLSLLMKYFLAEIPDIRVWFFESCVFRIFVAYEYGPISGFPIRHRFDLEGAVFNFRSVSTIIYIHLEDEKYDWSSVLSSRFCGPTALLRRSNWRPATLGRHMTCAHRYNIDPGQREPSLHSHGCRSAQIIHITWNYCTKVCACECANEDERIKKKKNKKKNNQSNSTFCL